MKLKVSVSFIKSKYDLENKTIEEINNTSCDYLHLDIMDGKFVENKNYNIDEVTLFLRENIKPLDVHLMCLDVKQKVIEYADLMPHFITFHLEAVNNIDEMIDFIHSYGIKCGIAINPETSVYELIPYLDKIELVLVMSVHPGLGGQKFIDESINKIDLLNSLNKGNFIVSVDGGINNETVNLVNSDMVVAGSYICMSDNYEKAVIS